VAQVRGVLVEAAWSAGQAPGPLRAFFQRIKARRGFQTAIVATARKMTILAWHLVTKDQDYAFARPRSTHHTQVRDDERIGYRALYPQPSPELVPGQLSLDNLPDQLRTGEPTDSRPGQEAGR
jgi:hypothetical protein